MMVIFGAGTPSCKQEACQSSVGQRVPDYHQKIPRQPTSTQFFHSLVCSTLTPQEWKKKNIMYVLSCMQGKRSSTLTLQLSTTPSQTSSKLSLATVLLCSAGDHDHAISAFLFQAVPKKADLQYQPSDPRAI